MNREARALEAVPRGVWVALLAALAVQLAVQVPGVRRAPGAAGLPPPPRPAALRLASFGEPEAAARLAMLYVQSVATRTAGGSAAAPDVDRLIGWLGAALDTDPRGDYPLFAAARVYADVPDAARMRKLLDFVYRAFLQDPDRRWPALAQAAILAKHRLKDLPLALRYARAIDRLATGPGVPAWARQMQIFILEDMNELQAAKVLLGGLLAAGRITDPAEARFLKQRLDALEARLRNRAARGGEARGRP